ncbi:MAG: RNA-directed DNA polymerase [Candidatus Omnitrophota bacterium]|jgi:RNA-directed DNA polymerase
MSNTNVTTEDKQEANVELKQLYPNPWLRIGYAARKEGVMFGGLLCHFNAETLREAYNALDPSKAVGLDGISKKVYGENLDGNLEDLVTRIHKGSYKPQVKREVLIPKADGKKRPIAISVFEDKLVEWVLGKVLESMYEPIFIRNSFGFRKNKSTHQAIQATYHSLKGDNRSNVVEIDFANFFNSIPHRKLMKILSQRTNDSRFKSLIGRFLKAGILEQSGRLSQPSSGTAQGSVMSPILANIYLHVVLDTWFLENYASYNSIIVRYADDAVFFFRSKAKADQFTESLGERVKAYGLELNLEKTNIINFKVEGNNSFTFLGFTFYWDKKRRGIKPSLKFKTQKKRLLKKIHEFSHWIKSIRSQMKLQKIWELAKLKLIGHYNYYGYGCNRAKLSHFYHEAIRSLFKWLNRRSQKKSYTWGSFWRRLQNIPLPTPPPMYKLKHLKNRGAYV